MHLVYKIEMNEANSNFAVLDFVSSKAKQLSNQIVYAIRQPWLYFDNLKNNQPVYPNQVLLISQLNVAIQQYNFELTQRNNLAQIEFNKINPPIENTNIIETTEVDHNEVIIQEPCGTINKEEEKVFKPKKLLNEVNAQHYWVDNKDLLQYYAKSLPNYQLLNSKSGQQIVHKVIDNFSSFRGLLKLYNSNKAKGIIGSPPRPPNYKERIQDRNLVEFNNQQFKIEKNYLVIGWQGNLLKGILKDNNNTYTEEIELDARHINKLTYKDKQGNTHYRLKNNKNIKQEIINREMIKESSTEEKSYQVILKTTYFNLQKKLRIKLPSGFNKQINNNLTKDNIKQLRIVPSNKSNPLAYTLEIVYEVKEYQLNNLVETYSKKPLLSALQQVLAQGTEKEQTKSYSKFIAGNYKITHELLEKVIKLPNGLDLLSNLRVCSLDPGMIRLFTLTNNIGLQPIIFKDKKLVAFNRWYNDVIAEHQEMLKKEWDKYTSKKHQNINLIREHKFNDWMHLLSNRIVQYLENNNFDLLAIGKNKGQKQHINLGKKTNQKFVQIPFTKLWDKIAYKAYKKGILVVEQEESYTSKSCFINNDPIPIYNKNKTKTTEQDKLFDEIVNKSKFTGKRSKGVYKTTINNNSISQYNNQGSITKINIHSDVNGSYNIMRKLFASIGISFNIQVLTKNKRLSRKLLHHLFMPMVVDFNSIDILGKLNYTINNKTKALEELEQAKLNQNKSLKECHGHALS